VPGIRREQICQFAGQFAGSLVAVSRVFRQAFQNNGFELRVDFRTFRTDRVEAAEFLEERYPERPAALRARWRRAAEAMWREMRQAS